MISNLASAGARPLPCGVMPWRFGTSTFGPATFGPATFATWDAVLHAQPHEGRKPAVALRTGRYGTAIRPRGTPPV